MHSGTESRDGVWFQPIRLSNTWPCSCASVQYDVLSKLQHTWRFLEKVLLSGMSSQLEHSVLCFLLLWKKTICNKTITSRYHELWSADNQYEHRPPVSVISVNMGYLCFVNTHIDLPKGHNCILTNAIYKFNINIIFKKFSTFSTLLCC